MALHVFARPELWDTSIATGSRTTVIVLHHSLLADNLALVKTVEERKKQLKKCIR